MLETISKPTDGPGFVTIFGDAGNGKTSLAATFPKPVFIRAEDGLKAVPSATRPDAFPLLKTAQDLWDQITALIKEDHKYETLVIDSVSKLDVLFTEEIMKTDGKNNLAQCAGGYGAGFQVLFGMHQRLRKACQVLQDKKGMNIVFIAHADVDKIEPPDMAGYSKYVMKITANNKVNCADPYINDVDLVGFIRLQTFAKGNDGEVKKAVSTGARELVCFATASNVSKNRFGITEPLPVELGVNPLAGLVPFIPAIKKEAK
jgi:AAA domain